MKRKLSIIVTVAVALVITMVFAAYAAQVGVVKNLRGQARVFPNGNPAEFVMAQVGMPITDSTVIQVAPNSAIQLQIGSGEVTWNNPQRPFMVAQYLRQGNRALSANVRRPNSGSSQVSSVAGVRASEVEGVDLGGLSWLTESNAEGDMANFVNYLNQLYQQGKYSVILQVVSQYFANNETTPDLLAVYGLAQFEFGMYEAAIESFNQIADTEKHAERAAYYISMAYYWMGEYETAIENLQAFETDYPESVSLSTIQLHAGYAFKEAGDEAQARAYFEKALATAQAAGDEDMVETIQAEL